MSRSAWNGTLLLGQVAIPVGLHPALRDGEIRLKRLHEPCGTAPQQQLHCHACERAVEPDELVRAFEPAPGQHLRLEASELEPIAPPASDRTIRIGAAIDREQLDELLLVKPYRLHPAKHATAVRAYSVLACALALDSAVAIARITAWGHDQACAIAPDPRNPGLLRLTTLRPLDDIAHATSEDREAALADVHAEDVELATKILRRLRQPLTASLVASPERDRLRQVVDAKLAGQPITLPQRTTTDTPATPAGDLTAALKRSLADTPARARRRAA